MASSEYTPLSYIESTGTQYIDTGINDEYILTMTVQFTNTGTRNLMGQSSDAGNYFGSSADGYFELGGDAISSVKATEKRKITVISTKTDITLTVEQGDTIVRNKTAVADTNLIICGGVSGYVCNAKIWDCTISTISGEIIRNFVPAEKDNVIGLYDRVWHKMYPNAGVGDFISGGIDPEPEPLPEYISPKTDWELTDYFNFEDWIRIKNNILYINDILYNIGWINSPLYNMNLERDINSLPTVDLVNRLEFNVQKLHNALGINYNQWPESKTWFARLDPSYKSNPTFEDWNRWETYTKLLKEWTDFATEYQHQRISGTFTAGNNYQRQLIRSI